MMSKKWGNRPTIPDIFTQIKEHKKNKAKDYKRSKEHASARLLEATEKQKRVLEIRKHIDEKNIVSRSYKLVIK